MADHLKHIESTWGNRVNVNGVAVLELTVGKDGRIVNARAISGHALASPLLLSTINKWRFEPLVQDETARQAGGRRSVQFAIVENPSRVEVAR